jgi:hypothetical protein
MIKAISGAQTGADMAALDAALACGFQTGGTMPWGYSTEDGRKTPMWAKKYGLVDLGPKPQSKAEWASNYANRTKYNVIDSDETIWFEWGQKPTSPGYWCTQKACFNAGKHPSVFTKPSFDTSSAIVLHGIKTIIRQNNVINFAGNRESKAPGIYDWVYGLLVDVFQELKAK